MILARVMGTVVATRKDERLLGKKLLVCRPVNPEGEAEGAYFVAMDTVGAGFHETVLVVSSSSARMAANFKESPVDGRLRRSRVQFLRPAATRRILSGK